MARSWPIGKVFKDLRGMVIRQLVRRKLSGCLCILRFLSGVLGGHRK